MLGVYAASLAELSETCGAPVVRVEFGEDGIGWHGRVGKGRYGGDHTVAGVVGYLGDH